MGKLSPVLPVIGAIVLGALACVVPFLEVEVDEWYVSTGGNDAHSCTSASLACRTIHGALAKTGGRPGVIHVAAGTYVENVSIGQSITILGEAAGTTIVDGGAAARVFDVRGPRDALAGAPISVLMSNLTIQNGRADNGGGLAVWDHATLNLVNSVIQRNQAVGNAGGVLNSGGQVTLNGVIVRGNTAANGCDGVDNYGERMELFRAQVRDHNGGGSGACNRRDGVMVVRSSQIVDNLGNGIFNRGVLNVYNTSISGNDDPATASIKAGIMNLGSLWISSSTVSGGSDGIFTSCYADIHRTTISGNREVGISLSDPARGESPCETGTPELIVRNSTISGNDMGVYLVLASFVPWRIEHATIAYNGVGFQMEGFVDLTSPSLANTIVANSLRRNCGTPMSIPSGGRNLDSDGSCSFPLGDHLQGMDPQLQPLANNGGPTATHRLRDGSPAIDRAEPGFCPGSDQRGVSRPIGGGCDIGAFERDFAIVAATPESTPTPDLVEILPTVTPPGPTVTPGPPLATFLDNTNCRSGPGTAYGATRSFLKGETAQVEGRSSAEPRWWWLLIPDSTTHCWVSETTVELDRPGEGLVVIPAPPVPTATTAPEEPAAPKKLAITAQVCTSQTYSVSLGWEDAADNEQGYRVYRNGLLVATLGANASTYTDQPPYGGPYTYGVEAYNAAGASSRPSVAEGGCIY